MKMQKALKSLLMELKHFIRTKNSNLSREQMEEFSKLVRELNHGMDTKNIGKVKKMVDKIAYLVLEMMNKE